MKKLFFFITYLAQISDKKRKNSFPTLFLLLFSERLIIKNKKSSNRVFKRLGCTITEFKEHIESNFVEGMSWDNYGYDTWHIDHIIPLDWFVKNSDNVFEANHYTNLRPIQAEKNMSKGDTLDMDLVKSYGIEDLLPVGVDK